MKEIRICISAGIFIALTILKFVSFDATAQVQEIIRQTLQTEYNQTQELVKLTKSISDKDVIKTVSSVKSEAAQVLNLNDAATTLVAAPLKSVKVVQTPTPTPKPTPTPEPTLPPKVAAFLDEQKAFKDRAIPANVSYDYGKLPFDYTAPVDGVTSSGFGYRVHPIANEIRFHYGTDFGADEGASVLAFADGEIYAIGENESFGKYLIIDHPDGYRSLYAHLSEHLKVSGAVKKGERVALVGQTGAATGPHLHFELTKNGVYLNPEFYV